MHILSFQAENFKRIRFVDITAKSRLIQITGANGEGKTSVMDALWAGIVGKVRSKDGKWSVPEKPVRQGAKNARQKIVIGDYKTGKRELIAERTINPDRSTSIKVTNADGTKYSDPQAMLKDLLGELTFDPLEFIQMKTAEQVSMLRNVAHVDYDFEEATAASEIDFKKRTGVNNEIKRLETEVAGFTVQDGLPKAKVNEVEILERINATDAINQKARQIDDAKREAQRALEEARIAVVNKRAARHQLRERKSDLEQRLAEVEKQLTALQETITPLEASEARIQAEVDAMPSGEYADVIELTKELQSAQIVNREIDRRERRMALEKDLEAKKTEAAILTRNIDKRNEAKAAAIAKAKLPVEGLTFDESTVFMEGIPIEQLGEAEQIRVSTLIAMSANPKLRVLRILHGEALDEKNLAVLAEMAEQHDFQIWMARVDTSGKVGIVLEDGEVKTDNYEAEASETNGNDR